MPWLILAGSVIGAGAGMYASDKASDAQKAGSRAAIDEQRRQYNSTLQMLDPARSLGYGATSDLANLYGYSLPQYQGANDLITGAGGAAGGGYATGQHAGYADDGVIKVDGRANRNGSPLLQSMTGGVFGSDSQRRKYGGYIDPIAGTVNIPGQDKRSAAATEYLRTGQGLSKNKNPGLGRIMAQIDAMRAQGYQYDPNALAEREAAGNFNPAAPGTPGNPGTGNTMYAGGSPGGGLAPTAPTTGTPGAGNMSRFFASPDYNFRMNEANTAVERSAAARTGALNPNTSRALLETSGSLAAGEYGTYVNRLLAMAGLGQTATEGAVNAGANAANNIGGYRQAIGDSNASGVMGGANSVTGAINGGLNSYLMLQYLKKG
jgi:hypothetical protein